MMVAFFVRSLVILVTIRSTYALVLYQRTEIQEWSFRSIFDLLRRGFTWLTCSFSTTDKKIRLIRQLVARGFTPLE